MAETYYAHEAQISMAEESTAGTTVSAPAHYPGHIVTFDFPDEKVDWVTVKGIGAGRDYNAVAEGAHSFEGSCEIILMKPDILLYAFGRESTVGTDDGAGGSDVDGATAVGATSIDVTSGTGYAANDYIQIGETTTAEIRKITNVSTNTLTLDKGLRRTHADEEVCNEVATTYTHTLAVADKLPSFTLEQGLDGSTDIRRKINGCQINTIDIGCEEEGMLKANIGILGMNSTAADTSITTTAIPTTVPYMFDEGVITNFGGAIAQAKSFKVSINNNLKANRYIQATTARNVYEIIPGNRTVELQITAVIQANTWTELMRPEGQTATSFSGKFSRSATDYIDVQCTGVLMTSCSQPIPEEGEIVADMTFTCKTCVIETEDTTPYYWMA